jgi:hypothetical protein
LLQFLTILFMLNVAEMAGFSGFNEQGHSGLRGCRRPAFSPATADRDDLRDNRSVS